MPCDPGAPETRYPGAIEDCYAGLPWVQQNATALGVDPAHIGIGGASAGGGLAAALALLARDRGRPGPAIASQTPHPSDARRPPGHQIEWLGRAHLAARIEQVRLGLLPRPNPVEPVPVYAAAARADDLSGLPPALIFVGALDGVLDEDVDYALRLNRAGVDVELHVYPGCTPWFRRSAGGIAVARQASADMNNWIARAYTR